MRNGWATEWKNSPNIWTHLGKKPNFCAIFEMFRNYFNTPEEKNFLLIIWNTHYEFEEEKIWANTWIMFNFWTGPQKNINWTLERKKTKYCGTSWKRTLTFYYHISFLSILVHPCIIKACKSTPKSAYIRDKIGQNFAFFML